MPKPPLQEVAAGSATPPPDAAAEPREVYWTELEEWRRTPVFRGPRLLAGNELAGPAIVDMPDTTIVVRPGMRAFVDGLGSVVIDLAGSPA